MCLIAASRKNGAMKQRIKKIFLILALALLVLAIAAAALFWVQGSRTPVGRPEYVALGSSFAAGAGLGPLQDESPLLCARSKGGYPQHLSRMLDLSIVDMTCGGAKTRHLLHGGQFFQGPQMRTIGKQTRLVTITVGGNDLGYSSDLSMLAARHTGTLFGWSVRQFWGGPAKADARDYAGLRNQLVSTIRNIRKKAPKAIVVLASYPAILPASGTCARLGLNKTEAELMREVANRFAAVSRAAAEQGGALFVDMHNLGASHHACAASPWTYGWTNADLAPFHPNNRGTRATAEAIAQALQKSPAAIAAIGKDDASGHQAGRVGSEEGDD